MSCQIQSYYNIILQHCFSNQQLKVNTKQYDKQNNNRMSHYW